MDAENPDSTPPEKWILSETLDLAPGLYQLRIADSNAARHAGRPCSNVSANFEQSNAENNGRVAGVGNSSLRTGSMVRTSCSVRLGSLARIAFAHS